ncbi:MAG: hypothetical protein ACU0BK_08035 [Shimia sp.]|uniref:hypothetical protein n=1 Tax=Shimia sp. TaxID=1954381 RepID=UPI004058637F
MVDGTGTVSLWDNRRDGPEFVSDSPMEVFEIGHDGVISSLATSEETGALEDGVARVYWHLPPDNFGFTDVAEGETFSGSEGDDIILVNPNQTADIVIDAGDGDDTITVGAHQSVTSALASGFGTAEDDGADVITVHLPAYEAPEDPSAATGEAGVIDFRDEDDSLTVVLPDPAEASTYLVHESEDAGGGASLHVSDRYFLVLGPPGVTVSDAELWDRFDAPSENSHLGLRVVSEIDLGAASGRLGGDGNTDWSYDHRNMDPDITFQGDLTGQVTVSY